MLGCLLGHRFMVLGQKMDGSGYAMVCTRCGKRHEVA